MWSYGRVSAGVVCMISAAWIGSSLKEGEAPFEAVMSLIGSFGVWVFAEWKDVSSVDTRVDGPHPHDVELANTVRSLLTIDVKRRLREQSFGESFPYSRLDPIRELASWCGAERELVDAELDNLLWEMVRLSKELEERIFEYGEPLEHRLDRWSLAPHRERISDFYSSETFAKIAEVDNVATELAEAADEFEKAFRRKSPESYRITTNTT